MTTILQTPLHVQVSNLVCPDAPSKKRRRFHNNYRELPPPLKLNFDNEINSSWEFNYQGNFDNSINPISTSFDSPRVNSNIRVCPNAPIKGKKKLYSSFGENTVINLFGVE